MAEQSADSPQTSTEAPASTAPSTTADVTSWAKEQAAKLETNAVSETTAAPAPDSSKAPAATSPTATADDGADDQSQPEAGEKLSRKQRDEQRRAEIRTEERARVEAEFKAAQEAESTRRAREEAEESLLATIQKAKAGDYNAALQLAQVAEGNLITLPKQTAREAQVYNAGRNAVLDAMAKDFEPSIRGIDGISDEDFTSLKEAPTSGQFAKAAIDVGRRLERTAMESKIATLEAENVSLKGQLAVRGPSPLSANGSNGHGYATAGKDMRSIAQQAAAELGIPWN